MPNALAINDYVQITIYQLLGSTYTASVLNYKVTAMAGAPTDLGILTAYDATVAPLYKDCMSADGEYFGTRLQVMSPTLRPSQVTNASFGVGSVADDMIPSQVCWVTRLTTPSAGRSFRGRNYFSGMAESANDADGTPTAAFLVTAGILADQLYVQRTYTQAAGITATLQPQIFSRTLGIWTEVTEHTVEQQWATQRRRAERAGGGPLPF